MKTLLALLLLSNVCLAQEKSIQIQPTVRIVITDEPCEVEPLHFAYAVETVLEEYALGCWYRDNGEVYVRLKNGNKYYDYRFLESNFKN